VPCLALPCCLASFEISLLTHLLFTNPHHIACRYLKSPSAQHLQHLQHYLPSIMKSATLALTFTSLLASAAIAQPHRQHHHQHVKKDVVWHTDWVSVTETVGVTTTIWVDAGQAPPTSAASQPSSSAVSVPASSPAAAVEGAQFFQPASQGPASSPSPSATSVPAALVASPVAATPTSPAQPPAQVQSASSSTSVYVPPTTTSSAPAASTSTAAAQAPASGGGSSHGQKVPTTPLLGSGHNGIGTGIVTPACGTAGLPDCAGDITYYESADSSSAPSGCGTVNDGTVEKVVALSKDMMGIQSNSGVGDDANPYCGKMVTIVYGGASVQAKVVDKCGGCNAQSIDLSHATFQALTPAWETLGRQQATWYFSD